MRTSSALRASRQTLATLILIALVPVLGLAAPRSALGAQDDDIPGVPASPFLTDSLTIPLDGADVFAIFMLAGQQMDVTVDEALPATTEFNLYLYPPTKDEIGPPVLHWESGAANPKTLTYVATQTGWYYVEVSRYWSSGGYTLQTVRSWPHPQSPASPVRVWGSDRYTTAVAIARENFPAWFNLDHVIIASGEDRAAADPLAAAGLCWTYGAPIMLVRADDVPSAVTNALRQISTANGGVTVHVVGGPVSVPEARLNEIAREVPDVELVRVLPAGNRYELAATIAAEMARERPTGHMAPPGMPKAALIANGADPEKFFDALALSAMSAANGYPILLVERDRIPGETANALASLDIGVRIVGGGPATVSEPVFQTLASGPPLATRWAGRDRYETAAVIAERASGGWLNPANTAVAARLPDALTGGAFAGLRGGPILITPTGELAPSTAVFLHERTTSIGECYVLGGPASVTYSTQGQIAAALRP